MISIVIPARELYDEVNNEFKYSKETSLQLEHSLISISLWESKWHKPYLSNQQNRTIEETIDYIRCMTLNKGVDPNVYYNIGDKEYKQILDYIENPMTATTFTQQKRPPSREIITSELVYYWMIELGIPFDPCQKWHFNRLMTLIEVCNRKNTPGKKMSKSDVMNQNKALNQARRAKHGSRG